MTVSPKRVPIVIRRKPNDTFDLPTSATTGRYLRHRATAEAAQRKRQRLLLRKRIAIIGIALAGYFVIGRDLLALGHAKTSNVSMEMQRDTHKFTNQVGKLLQSFTTPNVEGVSAVKFTSAASFVENSGQEAANASLAQDPIAINSRLKEWQELN